jgi:3-hydroxyacyl-[acyl-carrier-protein] dehydratase
MDAPVRIASDHPALAGHFPGRPIAPGVLIAALMLEQARREHPGLAVRGLKRMKFLRPLAPDEAFTVECGAPGGGGLRIRARVGDNIVAEGQALLA